MPPARAARKRTSTRATRVDDPKLGREPRYSCQATELLNFTKPLPWWDARQYVEDYTSGNATLGRILRGFIYLGYYYGTLAKAEIWRPGPLALRSLSSLVGRPSLSQASRHPPCGQPAPIASLNLQPGDFVKVKSYEEILTTLNTNNKNRGMHFDGEMVPYCGGTYRVQGRVERFIDEKTGYMKRLKTPAVILDGVVCRSRYSNHRMFCPRAIFAWWRESGWNVFRPTHSHKRASDNATRHAV